MPPKKSKVKVFKLEAGSPGEALNELMELLTGSGEEKLAEVFNEPGKKEPPCQNPLCPSCMHEHGLSAEQISQRVQDCFAVLTHDEMVKGTTILYGLVAKLFMETPFPMDQKAGAGLARFVQYLRERNEKFAFATQSGRDQEGAKH